MYTQLSAKSLELILDTLKKGGVGAIPTETVYGLAGDAENPEAINKIFEIKQRPTDHPLIIHIANKEMISRYAKNIPSYVDALCDAFWPGPLTLILPKADSLNTLVTGGENTVGLRCPEHPIAQQILTHYEQGLAAPSANTYGQLSPTRVEHVKDDLGSSIDFIADGGPCRHGIESTIAYCEPDKIAILRLGIIQPEDIERVTNIKPTVPDVSPIKAAGTHDKHYAPKTPLIITPTEDIIAKTQEFDGHCIVLSCRFPQKLPHTNTWIPVPGDYEAYAHHFYDLLHKADLEGGRAILIEALPNETEWDALRDRMKRAAQ